MKAIYNCFSQMIRQLKQDAMLVIMVFVPLLAGSVFLFVIPVIEKLLTSYIGIDAVLAPYYELFDLFLIILTPSMFNYVVAMVMLEEADNHMISYLTITPLGKAGYLLSRLGAIGLISFPVSIFISLSFHLSNANILMVIGIALAGSIQGSIIALLIVTLTANKVEGMAVGKMTTLFTVGAFAPYFITGKLQYTLSFLPSFWLAKAMQTNNGLALIISIFIAGLYIHFLYKKFIKKLVYFA
ncbi:MAG: ABC-type transport system, multidrug-familypermease [Herbinix sp.]|jgi:fluoroquinolone transport system permease protein|nr:ABC-type transport system, multidrug-familypermease [Herbinix sp.]